MTGGALARVQAALRDLPKEKPLLIALDGRCAAGKTTLASHLRREIGCSVIHMDDFFLRPHLRTEERLRQPGGNVDRERFREEVLLPWQKGTAFSYRPYDCHTQTLCEPVPVTPNPVTLVEGAYCCHPEFWDFYDLHIFLTISPKAQLQRIRDRNGADGLAVFQNRWIPLEERYFEAFSIPERCELCLDATTDEA